jgi:hypothetical protein
MDLVAARILPVPCERLRRRRRCCRAVGAKLVSLRGPDGLTIRPLGDKPDLGSINAKQLEKKKRRIGFDLNELLIDTQELDVRLQWRRIWRRLARLGRRLVALGNTSISDEAAICSEPQNRMSKELRELLKSLDAQMRVATNESMLNAMNQMNGVEVAPSCMASIMALRNQLKEQGTLKEDAGRLVLTQDYLFSSPSQAATFMLARAANGRTEWKMKDGRSLKQLQDAALEREAVSATS